MANYPATMDRPNADISPRALALIAGLSLLIMAVLAPFGLFGALGSIVVPGDAPATVNNLVESEGLFRAGIAAFLVVIMLDLVVAWALYVLLRTVHPTIALLTGWLRLAFAAVFASALVSLLDVAQLIGSAEATGIQPDQLQALVTLSLASFDNGWIAIALSIFGLHLLGLGYLVFKSAMFPISRILGVLLVVAAGGYLIDGFGMIVVPDYTWTVGTFAFLGEVVLIIALLWRAVTGFASTSARATEGRAFEPDPVAS
jgi:hypothetical protein